MGEGGGTQSNKVHKFALNDVSVSTVMSKIVVMLILKAAGIMVLVKQFSRLKGFC